MSPKAPNIDVASNDKEDANRIKAILICGYL